MPQRFAESSRKRMTKPPLPRGGFFGVDKWRAVRPALASRMANSIDTNRQLQQTYQPNHAAVVRLVNKARLRGRSVMRAANAPKNEKGT